MSKHKSPAPGQQSLIVTPPYPRRPPYFALKFLRLVDRFFGPQYNPRIVQILMYVVLTEDRRRYASEPTFWLSQIRDRIGLKDDSHTAALIQQAVQSGWLYWHKPSNRELATAWVLVPLAYECELSNGSEAEDHLPGLQPGYHPGYHPRKDPGKDPVKDPLSSFPNLNPSPSPKDAVEEVVEKLLQAAGVAKHLETIEASRKLGNSFEWMRAKIQHFQANKGSDWGPGLLATHLKCRSFAGTPANHGWPTRTTSVASRTPDAAAEAIRSTQQLERDRRERQLEFQFGPLVDQLSSDEQIDLLKARPDADRLIELFRSSHRARGKGGVVRRALLEEFAKRHTAA
ncbi:hypothetical protein Plim_4283 (plasmid) [Planctopirus limnophila DSM 3776]|uniref:Uncharacterized protein n=1 Tax=Planctopirus limnophila (strain ATCC 43296 / DSM 3776 / IFAM 1008 / Mu 290) TaxID=521674 RepID=D5SZH0_PLAL2|nr:hypothetical protein [Planctopirus limnophila]ADG70090.1 hypothetical protein Plim_4283 [Planctopirus limnophila DSM 3776]